jgi:mono/diheme cytochrome c family protein
VTAKPILVLALLAACKAGGAAGDGDGPHVFETMCAACHGPRGKPTEAMTARLGVRDLTAPTFRARVTAELVEAQVRRGSSNKLMPAFDGALSNAQIRAVAAFVAAPAFVSAAGR